MYFLKILNFLRNSPIRQIRGRWFQIWQWCFQVSTQKFINFGSKICKQKNLRVLISNMTTVFSNSSPKIPKWDIFCPKFKNFYIYTKLCSKTNSRTLISNMTITFSNSSQKYASLVPNLRIFILHQTLQSDKFEGIDFKYDNGFFKF